MAKAQQTRLDSRDADALDSLIDSRGWQLVEARLQREIGIQQHALERPADQLETAYTRGFIRALRLAVALPRQLESEALKGKKVTE